MNRYRAEGGASNEDDAGERVDAWVCSSLSGLPRRMSK